MGVHRPRPRLTYGVCTAANPTNRAAEARGRRTISSRRASSARSAPRYAFNITKPRSSTCSMPYLAAARHMPRSMKQPRLIATPSCPTSCWRREGRACRLRTAPHRLLTSAPQSDPPSLHPGQVDPARSNPPDAAGDQVPVKAEIKTQNARIGIRLIGAVAHAASASTSTVTSPGGRDGRSRSPARPCRHRRLRISAETRDGRLA
jgi:hypothetical protein